MKHFLILFILLISISCKQNSESQPILHTYEEVGQYLNSESFDIDETTDTSESEWITSARYQSKDGQTGFLTLGMKGKDYYFDDVPINIWEEFKEAESKGKFYHKKIKGNYTLPYNKVKTSIKKK